jgi:hypothetical protein
VARHTFLEKIQAAAKSGEASEATAADPGEKPASPEAMTDEELEAAITTARRDLLDAQHQELREREVSRVAKAPEAPRASRLAEVLGGLQTHKRRTWR